jgi:hypothetical protein
MKKEAPTHAQKYNDCSVAILIFTTRAKQRSKQTTNKQTNELTS